MWRGSLFPTFKQQLPGPFSPFFPSSVEGRLGSTALPASPQGDPTLGLGKVGEVTSSHSRQEPSKPQGLPSTLLPPGHTACVPLLGWDVPTESQSRAGRPCNPQPGATRHIGAGLGPLGPLPTASGLGSSPQPAPGRERSRAEVRSAESRRPVVPLSPRLPPALHGSRSALGARTHLGHGAGGGAAGRRARGPGSGWQRARGGGPVGRRRRREP